MDAMTTPEPLPEGDRPSAVPTTPDTTAALEYQLVLSDPTGIEAEAIRALRTRIIAQHLREGRRALAAGLQASLASSGRSLADLLAPQPAA